MQKRFNIHRWLLTAWIILWGCIASFAWTDTQSGQPVTPPGYCFRTTSVYLPTAENSTAFVPIADGASGGVASRPGVRRNTYDLDDPTEEDNPIGVIPNPAPVGSPWGLLVWVFLYILYRYSLYRKSADSQKK